MLLGTVSSEAIWQRETELIRRPESLVCPDDLDFNPFFVFVSCEQKTQLYFEIVAA